MSGIAVSGLAMSGIALLHAMSGIAWLQASTSCLSGATEASNARQCLGLSQNTGDPDGWDTMKLLSNSKC